MGSIKPGGDKCASLQDATMFIEDKKIVFEFTEHIQSFTLTYGQATELRMKLGEAIEVLGDEIQDGQQAPSSANT